MRADVGARAGHAAMLPETPLPDTAPPTPARMAAFRQVMGQFATGVAVVALVPAGGGVSAMTINSLVSVSLDPLLVAWSLQNASSQADDYRAAERFAISILGEDQQALARRYAARGDSGLILDDFEPGAGGLPVIRGAIGTIACRRFAAHPAGDHTVILGEVTDMAQSPGVARPLVFFAGRFGGLER
jgi:flavin reductase (DIM6/NTAB) family NADH-FMN oxidoreductase RutF